MTEKRDGAVVCPYCGSGDTEIIAAFGQQLLTAQYYCNTCRTPFERVKGDDVLRAAERQIDVEQADRTGL